MAQKTGHEETDFKSIPETLNLCVNNCGVTGNPSTNNMCQNCFTTTATSSSSFVSHKFEKSLISALLPAREVSDADLVVEETKVVLKRVVNRCSGCKRKVGLTGFRCRCGDMFCSEHRYSDRHDCGYDYKEAGRKAITRENPVVRAAKMVKL